MVLFYCSKTGASLVKFEPRNVKFVTRMLRFSPFFSLWHLWMIDVLGELVIFDWNNICSSISD
jgi:hypothetical protein